MKTEVDLVSIGGGNIGSVRRMLERLDIKIFDVGPDKLPQGERALVLPGVGSFGAVMKTLNKSKLSRLISKLVWDGTPYLGICVGMQILFDSSEESPDEEGLGIIAGKVERFKKGKVPQIGWNQINLQNKESKWAENGFVYFVNSYHAVPEEQEDILYSADYHDSFCAAIKKEHITGFQFHPEKSGQFGEEIMQRWISDEY